MTVALKPGVGYPQTVVTFARRLHQQNGWSAHQIRKSLVARGYTPCHNTVLGWIDPDYAELRRELSRREKRRLRGPARARRMTIWDARLARMRELRDEVRLSASATARVMAHDFDLTLNRHQVEDLLAGRVKKTKTIRRLLYPQGLAS